MAPDLQKALQLAIDFAEGHPLGDEMRITKKLLQEVAIRKGFDGSYGQFSFLQDLVLAALSIDASVTYSEDAPTMSHVLWWLHASGASVEAIEDVLREKLYPSPNG